MDPSLTLVLLHSIILVKIILIVKLLPFFKCSTAGHEASGTGSMKFLMNGCLLLATADGSTVEIIEEIGADNMVIDILVLHSFVHSTLSIY